MAKEPLVIDDADLFTAEEEAVLEEKCEQMSSDYNTTVWVYTSSVPQYSDNYARDMRRVDRRIGVSRRLSGVRHQYVVTARTG